MAFETALRAFAGGRFSAARLEKPRPPRANPEPSRAIFDGHRRSAHRRAKALTAEFAAARLAHAFGRGDPHPAIAPPRDTGDAAVRQALSAAPRRDPPRSDDAHAAFGADPHPAVLVVGEREHVIAGQSLRRREPLDMTGTPAHEPGAACADPHRTVAILQQHACVHVEPVFRDRREPDAVESEDPGPRADQQIAVAGPDHTGERVVSETFFHAPAVHDVIVRRGDDTLRVGCGRQEEAAGEQQDCAAAVKMVARQGRLCASLYCRAALAGEIGVQDERVRPQCQGAARGGRPSGADQAGRMAKRRRRPGR